MKAEQIKIKLISWIASLKQNDWLARLVEMKRQLEKEPRDSIGEIVPAKALRGYGKYAGQIVMSDDFDEPLSDFKNYT